ncbi:MAG: HEPN domain-containing protein [candidate division NC10 bacterium]|nr:HEPN domain-containing protein [candidate division NC10 bacterium]
MNRTMIVAEWNRATRSFQAAELLTREGYYADAVSRAYYAILHAAKAALQVHDVAVESHAAVKRMFGYHLVRIGAIEREWSAYLAEGLDDRLAADYDATLAFSERDAQEECDRARAFLTRIGEFLLASGLTPEELRTERFRGEDP